MKPWARRLAEPCFDEEFEVFMNAFADAPSAPLPINWQMRPPEAVVSMPLVDDHLIETFGPVPSDPYFEAKRDQGKPDWSLMPWGSLEPVVEVLMFGAEKYGPECWRDVPDAHRRYWSAAQRHLIAHIQGETTDEESGLPHLAHAACCVLFLLGLKPRDCA